jgi:hypothetical protein
MQDINRTQQNKPGQNSTPGNSGAADGVLPLFAAVLNELQQLGIECTATNDDTAGALVIRVNGAQVETTAGNKKRFSMRQAQGGNDANQ